MWAGQFLSIAGDQLARVALTVLVYDRTRSPLWTAVTYAATYLPWLAGGLVLSPLADRFPRRAVLVTCDLIRCALTALIAVPGVPLPAAVALVFAGTFLEAPFVAARSATYADILRPDQDAGRYQLGIAMAMGSLDVATVAGFAAGGVLVAVIGARPAIAADAVTFAVSAACIWFGVRARPAARTEPRRGGAIRMVAGDRTLRVMAVFGALAAFTMIPQALAVPYAARLGGGPAAAGILFAAAPAGAAAGLPLLTRLVPAPRRDRWMAPLAAASALVLAVCLIRPGLVVSAGIFAVSGALTVYQVTANTRFVRAVPPGRRGEAFGVASALIWTSQGVAFLLAGAAATVMPAYAVIALAGVAGAGAAVLLGSRAREPRTSSPSPDGTAPARKEETREPIRQSEAG
jgi:MFS family permease